MTREELLNIIETDYVQCGEAVALARMALAAMDSEPVAWLLSGGGAENVVRFDSGNAYADPLREVTPLYRHAQPALVVPKEMTAGIAVKYWEGGRGSIESFVAGYNFCRAAMLAAAPQSPGSEPATVPGKWIPVSERIPDEGDHVLVSDGVGMEVSWIRGREWKKLRHIYSEDITHWMPLPAAPQETDHVRK